MKDSEDNAGFIADPLIVSPGAVVAQERSSGMSDELWRISAVEAVARLRNGEISPLELVDASARRIAEVEMMPCLDQKHHVKQ